MILCARSADNDYGGLGTYRQHYAPRSEMRGGICKKCRDFIARHHWKVQHGQTEKPAEFKPKPDIEHDHAGIGEHGEIEPAIQFDYGAVDELAGTISACPVEAREQAAEIIAQVFAWCFDTRPPNHLRQASARLAVIVSGLRPDICGMTLQQIAEQCGYAGKQSISKIASAFTMAFGLQFSRSRNAQARQHMAEAMRQSHRRRSTQPPASKESFAVQPSDTSFRPRANSCETSENTQLHVPFMASGLTKSSENHQ